MYGLDLFSGIGGITEALEGYVQPIAYCENDPRAQMRLLARMASGALPHAPIWDDVQSLRAGGGGHASTLSTEVSLARIFQSPIKMAKAWKASEADFLARSCELPMTFDHSSSSWKTYQKWLSGFTPSHPPFPKDGMTLDGRAYALPSLAHRRCAKGGSVWPSPMASDSIRATKRISWVLKHVENQKQFGRGGCAGILEVAAAEFGELPSPHLAEWIMGLRMNETALPSWATQYIRRKRGKRSKR